MAGLHRFERSGVLAGLTRVRSFSQDDAHCFVTHDQIEAEVQGVIRMILDCYKDSASSTSSTSRPGPRRPRGMSRPGRTRRPRLRPPSRGSRYQVSAGEGAFYAPKIDFMVRDALLRQHQFGTIQVDFTLPERFDLRYSAPEGGSSAPP